MFVLVTGSSGLIGSAAVEHFHSKGYVVVGIDNNGRKDFFGPQGDTTWNLNRMNAHFENFKSLNVDIRNFSEVEEVFRDHSFDVVVHCAAQPSHDKAADFPLVDFGVNAVGTINLLEAFRLYTPKATFLHMSTNKVYGDGPNHLKLIESKYRYDFQEVEFSEGISENFSIDNCIHSLFGASKLSGDVVAQEYGKYFGLNVGVFRGGCLTGPSHSGVELHGFLSYLIKCVIDARPYTIFGYGGKQVRDQIHSKDVMRAFDLFISSPKPGEVYNLGGGKANSASVLETIQMVEEISGKKLEYQISESARVGDHICYYSDLRKLKTDFPQFSLSYSLPQIVQEMVDSEIYHQRTKVSSS